MNILITGGAGYIGSVLTNKLVTLSSEYCYTEKKFKKISGFDEASHFVDAKNITVLDNLMYHQTTLTDHCYRSNFNFVYGSVSDKTLLETLVKNADLIFPLAAIVGFPACDKNPDLAEQINYDQIKDIISFCKNGQKIIFPNTNSGYGIGQNDLNCTEETPLSPISIYGKTKCNAEELVLKYGGIVLRLATVFGVSQRMRLDLLVNDFVYKALVDGYLVLFEKDFYRNYIHVQDVALTFIYMMNSYEMFKGQVFNVGLSDANLSKLQLANKIKKYIPDLVVKYEDFKKDIDQRNYIVSNRKLEKTGWSAYYSLDDGIKELIKAYKIIIPNNRKFTNL